MSVLRVGKEQNEQICQAFRELIRAANECKKVPKSYWALLPAAQFVGFASVVLIGASEAPVLSPVKVSLNDCWTVVLALALIVSLVTLVAVIKKHNFLVNPIRQVMKVTPEICKATTITHENHAGAKVSVIATSSGEIVCSMAFNPADGELVRLAYKVAGKKPPMIFNNIGV